MQKTFSNSGWFFNWLVQSSNDPTQVALTVKGLAAGVLPVALVVLHGANLAPLPDELYIFVVVALGIVSGLIAIYGIIRKIYFTIIPPAA